MQKNIPQIRLILIIALLLIPHLPLIAQAKLVTVEAQGVGYAMDNNPATARDAALADARLRAVELALGVEVDARTIIQRGLLVDDTLVTKTRGLVRQCTILDEQVEAGGLYRLRVEAVVDTEIMSSALQRAAGTRRVLVVAPQSAKAGPYGATAFIPELLRNFREAGFTQHSRSLDPEQYDLLDPAAIQALAGRRAGVAAKVKAMDLVLTVSLRGQEASCPVDNYCAARVSGALELWSGQSGASLARAEVADGRGFGNTGPEAERNGLRKTGEMLCNNLIEQLFHPPVRDLQIVVEDIADFAAYQSLAARLRTIRWLREARPDAVGYHPRRSVFLARFAGDPDVLGNLLAKLRDYRYRGRSGSVLTLEREKGGEGGEMLSE